VVGSERHVCSETECIMALQRYKVIYFGANGYRVCDFLLVINSNLGPILPRFRDIAFFSAEKMKSNPTHVPPEFWGFPLE